MLQSAVESATIAVPAVQPLARMVDGCSDAVPCQNVEMLGGNGSEADAGYQIWYSVDEPISCLTDLQCKSSQACQTGYCTTAPECGMSVQYSDALTLKRTVILSAVACSNTLSQSNPFTLEVPIKLMAPAFEISVLPVYPRALNITSNQSDHAGFQVWYILSSVLANVGSETSQLSCVNKENAVLYEQRSTLLVYQHSEIQAIACATLAAEEPYSFRVISVSVGAPIAEICVAEMRPPWRITLQGPLTGSSGLSLYWWMQTTPISSMLLSCGGIANSAARLYNSSAPPTITTWLSLDGLTSGSGSGSGSGSDLTSGSGSGSDLTSGSGSGLTSGGSGTDSGLGTYRYLAAIMCPGQGKDAKLLSLKIFRAEMPSIQLHALPVGSTRPRISMAGNAEYVVFATGNECRFELLRRSEIALNSIDDL